MNILLINYEYPPKGGGASNASYFLAHQLAKTNHKVFVLTGQYRKLPQTSNDGKIKIFRVPAKQHSKNRTTIFEMVMFIIQSYRTKRQIISRTKPDVVLAFFGIPSGVIALFLKKQFGIPYVISLRGGDVPGHMPYSLAHYHKFLKPLIKTVWRQAFAVVANSKTLRQLALPTATSIKKQILIIPNGIDNNIFHPNYNTNNNKVVRLLYVGRLSYEKGLSTLIDAIDILVLQYHDSFKLTIVGDGPEKKLLMELVDGKSLGKYVNFRSWVNKQQIASLYRRHDIFILPSLDEGMSNTLLEAMASQLAVVVSAIDANKELVENYTNGLLFKLRDSNDLAEKLHLLIKNKKLTRRLANGGCKTSKQYQWGKSAKQYLDLLTRAKQENKNA